MRNSLIPGLIVSTTLLIGNACPQNQEEIPVPSPIPNYSQTDNVRPLVPVAKPQPLHKVGFCIHDFVGNKNCGRPYEVTVYDNQMNPRYLGDLNPGDLELKFLEFSRFSDIPKKQGRATHPAPKVHSVWYNLPEIIKQGRAYGLKVEYQGDDQILSRDLGCIYLGDIRLRLTQKLDCGGWRASEDSRDYGKDTPPLKNLRRFPTLAPEYKAPVPDSPLKLIEPQPGKRLDSESSGPVNLMELQSGISPETKSSVPEALKKELQSGISPETKSSVLEALKKVFLNLFLPGHKGL